MNKYCACWTPLSICLSLSKQFFFSSNLFQKLVITVSVLSVRFHLTFRFCCFFRGANHIVENEKRILEDKHGRFHLPPVRQILPIEAQSGQTFEIRVRWPETLHLLPVSSQIHPERKAEAAHA